MDYLNPFFKNLIFTRVQRNGNYYIYAVKIEAAANNRARHVLLFVPSNTAVYRRAKISSLRYDNLQTRNITDKYRLTMQRWSYDLSRTRDPTFTRQKRNRKFSTYRPTISSVPLHASLVNTNPDGTRNNFPSRMKLSQIIESFASSIQIENDDVTSFDSPLDRLSQGNTSRRTSGLEALTDGMSSLSFDSFDDQNVRGEMGIIAGVDPDTFDQTDVTTELERQDNLSYYDLTPAERELRLRLSRDKKLGISGIDSETMTSTQRRQRLSSSDSFGSRSRVRSSLMISDSRSTLSGGASSPLLDLEFLNPTDLDQRLNFYQDKMTKLEQRQRTMPRTQYIRKHRKLNTLMDIVSNRLDAVTGVD
jgi:hypothetical protein